ncbi:MAG: hypothetical protein WBE29_17365 [Pseudolabrys sp.]
MQLCFLEVDILPAQAAQFGGPQAAEDRREQERAPLARGGTDNALDLVRCRNINPDLQFLASTVLAFTLTLSPTTSPKLNDRVAHDQAALLRV